MDEDVFIKSDIGAQAAWKGFSSQTLYIAYRLVTDIQGYEYYPEDIEDLVVKYNGEVIEAVQVKNITAALTISHLSSTKTSKGGEGFFKRMCSLHSKYSNFKTIKVVYFGDLGVELQDLEKGVEKTKENIREKLVDNHGLLYDDAEWLLNSLKFEKVEEKQLTDGIHQQIKSYMPIMAAPYLAQSLLVQYISKLSKEKGERRMNKAFEKILERLGEKVITVLDEDEHIIPESNIREPHKIEMVALSDVKEIMQEVAEEYKGDMKHNLAEMYAKNMVDYGVDVTKAWQPLPE